MQRSPGTRFSPSNGPGHTSGQWYYNGNFRNFFDLFQRRVHHYFYMDTAWFAPAIGQAFRRVTYCREIMMMNPNAANASMKTLTAAKMKRVLF